MIERVAGERLLPGMGYGLQHPVLWVPLQLAPTPSLAPSRLQQLLDEWIVDPFPPAARTPPADARVALLHTVHDACQALLREQNVAVFGPCAVLRRAQMPAMQVLLALPSPDVVSTLAALDWVLQGVNLLLPTAAPDEAAVQAWQQRLVPLRDALRQRSTTATNPIRFAAAAHHLGLPMTKLAPGLTQVGLGRAGRWLNSSLTDATPGLGVSLARRKDHSASLLRRAGLPLPAHQRVSSADQAVAVAQSLGWPVVVKPADQDQGRGVFARLTDAEQVRRAVTAASGFSKHVLVEQFVVGEDYRLGVAFGRVVQVLHRRAAHVVGDGRSRIAELVLGVQGSVEHLRAYRRTGRRRLELDAEALELLAEQRLAPDTVLAPGQQALLRRKSNISSGGTHRLVPLADVHPDNVEMALRAAAVLRLDMAGVDFISPDIAQPWHANGGAICEVNAQPQFGARDMPALHGELLRQLVGEVDVPVHVLLVDAAAPQPSLQRVAALAQALRCNAWSGWDQGWVAGVQVGHGCRHGVDAAWTVLLHRGTAGALLVLTAQELLRLGLPVARLSSLRVASDPADGQVRAPVLRQALALAAPHAQHVLAWPLDDAGSAT